MSDKEIPDPSEPIPWTRDDHKRLWFHYDKIDAMSESTAELREWQREKIEKLEKRCNALGKEIGFIYVIVAILAFHALGWID